MLLMTLPTSPLNGTSTVYNMLSLLPKVSKPSKNAAPEHRSWHQLQRTQCPDHLPPGYRATLGAARASLRLPSIVTVPKASITNLGMSAHLTDQDRADLVRILRYVIDADPYPLSP